MDSLQIAETINTLHPSPPLKITSPQLTWFLENYATRIMTPFRGIYLPLVPRRLLADESVAYWYESKAKLVGKSVDEIEREEGGERAYERLAPVLREITAMLREDPSGPFFGGNEVGYVDFFWAGFLLFARRIGEDVLEGVLERCDDGGDGGGGGDLHRRLLDAVAPWSVRCAY